MPGRKPPARAPVSVALEAPLPLFLSGQVAGKLSVWPLAGPSLGLGRSSRLPVCVPDPTVSKDHAEIVLRGDTYFLQDLGSRNGTRVNGVAITSAVPLRAGDVLSVGQVTLQVTEGEPAAQAHFAELASLNTSAKFRVDQMLKQPSAELKASAPLLRTLAEAGRLLVLPRPLAETCDQIMGLVEQAVPASRHALLLRGEPGAPPVQVASRSSGHRPGQPLALSSSVLRLVLDECTSVLSEDASADPRFSAQASIAGQAVHSVMAVPLFDNERVLGLIYVDTREPGVRFSGADLEVLSLLANMAAVKITNVRLLEAEQQQARIAQELATAARIQRGLLPPRPPEVPGWALAATLETCYEVGGDLYDFHLQPDGRILFMVGDVSGKGVGASLLMSTFLATARALYHTCQDVERLAAQLNHLMCERTEDGHFITGFLGCLDPATGALHYVNGGHPPALAVLGRELRRLDGEGMPFGIFDTARYVGVRSELRPGELLALYSDGIPEARRGDTLYEDERLEELLLGMDPGLPLEEVRRRVLHSVSAWSEGEPRGDDITLMLLRRETKRGA